MEYKKEITDEKIEKWAIIKAALPCCADAKLLEQYVAGMFGNRHLEVLEKLERLIADELLNDKPAQETLERKQRETARAIREAQYTAMINDGNTPKEKIMEALNDEPEYTDHVYEEIIKLILTDTHFGMEPKKEEQKRQIRSYIKEWRARKGTPVQSKELRPTKSAFWFSAPSVRELTELLDEINGYEKSQAAPILFLTQNEKENYMHEMQKHMTMKEKVQEFAERWATPRMTGTPIDYNEEKEDMNRLVNMFGQQQVDEWTESKNMTMEQREERYVAVMKRHYGSIPQQRESTRPPYKKRPDPNYARFK